MITRRPFDLWDNLGDRELPARINSAWLTQIARCCELTGAIMVVELITGDLARFRVATELVEVSDAAGHNRFVAPVLMEETEIANNYDLRQGSSSARSASFTVPSWFIRPQERIAGGQPLAGFAEVSLLMDGMTWNDRRVLIRGDVTGGVSFGAHRDRIQVTANDPESCDSGAFSFEVSDPRSSADAMIPVAGVSSAAWSMPPDVTQGSPYPLVFGGGVVEAVLVSSSATDPIYVAAYGHDFTISAVYRNGEAVAGSEYSVSAEYDDDGIPVTVIDFGGGVLADFEDTDTITAEIESTIDPAPELLTVARSVLQEHTPAGELLANPVLFAEAQIALGTLPIRTVINERTSVLQWLEGGLVEDLPMVSWVWQAGRYGPVVTDWRRPARTQLTVGTDRLRFVLGDPTESPKFDVFNSFRVLFDYSARADNFRRVVEATPETHPVLRMSELACGSRAHPDIESVVFADDSVAFYLIDWMVAHLSLPTMFIECIGAPCLFFELARGDNVDLTVPDLSWYGVRASVERMIYRRGQVQIGFRVWQNALRNGPFPAAPS